MLNLLVSILAIFITIFIISLALWISARMYLRKGHVNFNDIFWIVGIGIITSLFTSIFFKGYGVFVIQLIIWLYLIKVNMLLDWGQTLVISMEAVILSIVTTVILGITGFSFINFY